jgi:hypothetical protein
MQVCVRDPIEQSLDGRRVLCWLHGPEREIPEGGTEPLQRAKISVADEA